MARETRLGEILPRRVLMAQFEYVDYRQLAINTCRGDRKRKTVRCFRSLVWTTTVTNRPINHRVQRTLIPTATSSMLMGALAFAALTQIMLVSANRQNQHKKAVS